MAIKASLPVVLWLALGAAEREHCEHDKVVCYTRAAFACQPPSQTKTCCMVAAG